MRACLEDVRGSTLECRVRECSAEVGGSRVREFPEEARGSRDEEGMGSADLEVWPILQGEILYAKEVYILSFSQTFSRSSVH